MIIVINIYRPEIAMNPRHQFLRNTTQYMYSPKQHLQGLLTDEI